MSRTPHLWKKFRKREKKRCTGWIPRLVVISALPAHCCATHTLLFQSSCYQFLLCSCSILDGFSKHQVFPHVLSNFAKLTLPFYLTDCFPFLCSAFTLLYHQPQTLPYLTPSRYRHLLLQVYTHVIHSYLCILFRTHSSSLFCLALSQEQELFYQLTVSVQEA